MSISLFGELALLVGIAAGLSMIIRLLRQPLVIAYIITGLLVGPLLFNLVDSGEIWQLFSEIGISILLFIVGLGLTPRVIREVGTISLITGVGQVAFTTVTGFLLCILLGFDYLTAGYIAVALSFSSTIIILKLLSDKNDLDKLYAKISIGFLLVQDLIAVLLLLLIPLMAEEGRTPFAIFATLGWGTLLIGLVYAIAHVFFLRMNQFLATSRELLFLFSIAWGIGVAAIFQTAGFSLESGALIAGVSLAVLPSRHEIASRLMPLRDFFILIFFVLLGARMSFDGDLNVSAAIWLSLLVLIGNPLLLMALMGIMGFRKKTGLQTGFTVAQISEFSLILIALGVTLGHLAPNILSLITLVGLITIFISTYLVLYSDAIYRKLRPLLALFERSHLAEPVLKPEAYRSVLFGYSRIGFELLSSLQAKYSPVLVVDHDPTVVKKLNEASVAAYYGDADDPDFIRSLPTQEISVAVSTIPELGTNLFLLQELRTANASVSFVAVAHQISDALALYQAGTSFVILPHFLGGKHAAMMLRDSEAGHEALGSLRESELENLHRRLAVGQEHPTTGRSHTYA